MGRRGRVLGIIVADGDDTPLATLGGPGGPALTPFAGKYRFIDFALATLRNSGVLDVCVVTPFPAARLRAHLERALPGRRPRILPLVGRAPTRASRLGAALRAAGALVRDLEPETVAILLADHILLCDLRPLVAAHAARAADVTLPALSLPASEIDGRIRLHTDGQGRVDLRAGTSAEPAPFVLTWAGDAVVRGEVVASVLALPPSADEPALRAYAAALRIDAYDVLGSHGSAGCATGAYWHEPMSLEAYYGAQMELCTQRPPLDLYNPTWPLPTAAGGLAPAKVVADAAGRAGQALDSLVSDGSVIRGGVVVKSVLGHGVVVESGAEVEDSVLLDGCRIGRGARVRRALIGAGAIIADEEEIGYGAAAPAAVGAHGRAGGDALIRARSPAFLRAGSGVLVVSFPLPPMDSAAISIVGAREHNLKGIDVEVPLGRLTVVTGVSGSGKSSFAFDILYAEGQRRYVESFSTYARQFLDRMDRPHVERIEGILPAIAIDQSRPVKTSRSTVGTMTELHDYLKLLFAKAAVPHCRSCGRPVRRDSAESAADRLLAAHPEARALITFTAALPAGLPWPQVREGLLGAGFLRALTPAGTIEIAEAAEPPETGSVTVVQDRLRLRPADRARLVESLEQALRHGRGRAAAVLPDAGCVERFSTALECAQCGFTVREPVPNLFSFNSPLGACETCRGFGRVIDLDLDLVIPDASRSLADGAIKPWTTKATSWERGELLKFCRRRGIPVDVPWRDLDDAQRRLVLDGDGRGHYPGVRGWFRWLEGRTYRMHVRVLLSRYRSYTLCPACAGARVRPEALDFRLGGLTIADVNRLTIGEAERFFATLPAAGGPAEAVAALVLEEVRSRLRYLVEVGLDYLTLDRQSRTLSGGELERVDLTTALGSSLVNTLYVLDEPSIGLHPRDTERLVRLLHRLRDQGNTVVVVEHDPAIIRAADHVIDLGPGAGERGGKVVFAGPPAALAHARGSITADYLTGRRRIPRPARRRRPIPGLALSIRGARAHNLRDLDVHIPLACFVAVTGVSGSGKSTLVEDVLYRTLMKRRGRPVGVTGECRALEGADRIGDVVLVDQAPIGATPRANAATYLRAFD